MWQTKIQDDGNRLEKFLPFILMLKAKVAYSKGRKHVNDAYEKILNRCLDELEEQSKATDPEQPEIFHGSLHRLL